MPDFDRDRCADCGGYFDWFSVPERDATGFPLRLRFIYGCPNPKPIPDAILGTYTAPFELGQHPRD